LARSLVQPLSLSLSRARTLYLVRSLSRLIARA